MLQQEGCTCRMMNQLYVCWLCRPCRLLADRDLVLSLLVPAGEEDIAALAELNQMMEQQVCNAARCKAQASIDCRQHDLQHSYSLPEKLSCGSISPWT
jgi:hypothetical protein